MASIFADTCIIIASVKYNNSRRSRYSREIVCFRFAFHLPHKVRISLNLVIYRGETYRGRISLSENRNIRFFALRSYFNIISFEYFNSNAVFAYELSRFDYGTL